MTNVIQFEKMANPRAAGEIELLVHSIHDAMERGIGKDEFLKCIDELWDGVIAEGVA